MSEIKCANCDYTEWQHSITGPDGRSCPSFTARPDDPTDADLEKLGNRAMGFLVAKYGYPQLDRFVNWSARPEQVALEMAEFVYWLQSQPETPVTARPDEGGKAFELCGCGHAKGEHERSDKGWCMEEFSCPCESFVARPKCTNDGYLKCEQCGNGVYVTHQDYKSRLAAERTRRQDAELLFEKCSSCDGKGWQFGLQDYGAARFTCWSCGGDGLTPGAREYRAKYPAQTSSGTSEEATKDE